MEIDDEQIEYLHRGFLGRLPSRPHDLTERQTPTSKAIVLCHMGVPKLSLQSWQLSIAGLVKQPRKLTFDDLRAFAKREIESVHQCAGSPLRPEEPAQRVCNVVWGGVSLSSVLAESGVSPEATFLWSQGADSGSFGDLDCGPYIKDLPLDRIGSDVLLAYEMNGLPLLPEHGFPVRLVVPGFYGTNSVKWLASLTLTDRRASSPFTERWYLDRDASGERTVPVWRTAPQSIIVSPSPEHVFLCDEAVEIWGWAWGDEQIDHVDVSTDDGANDWVEASLEGSAGHGWRRFAMIWRPSSSGTYRVRSRAASINGAIQPMDGRRNAQYAVSVTVA